MAGGFRHRVTTGWVLQRSGCGPRHHRCPVERLPLFSAVPAQGALKGWVPLCEAIVSWHIIRCDGLRHDLMQLMQAFKANLVKARPFGGCH